MSDPIYGSCSQEFDSSTQIDELLQCISSGHANVRIRIVCALFLLDEFLHECPLCSPLFFLSPSKAKPLISRVVSMPSTSSSQELLSTSCRLGSPCFALDPSAPKTSRTSSCGISSTLAAVDSPFGQSGKLTNGRFSCF